MIYDLMDLHEEAERSVMVFICCEFSLYHDFAFNTLTSYQHFHSQS